MPNPPDLSPDLSPFVRMPRISVLRKNTGAVYHCEEDRQVYRVATRPGNPAKNLATEAIGSKLFETDGHLLNALLGIHSKKEHSAIAVVGDVYPIGVAVVVNGHCQVYVSPDHRRQGLGSRMIALLAESGVTINKAAPGHDKEQSENFWASNDISVR